MTTDGFLNQKRSRQADLVNRIVAGDETALEEFYNDASPLETPLPYDPVTRKFDAYDADNFMVGMSRIKTGIDRGNLKITADSLAHSQLQSITRPDLADNPEQKFYALNGLRHVISGFHRNPPIIPVITPTGSSIGEIIVLAKVSQKTRNTAPHI